MSTAKTLMATLIAAAVGGGGYWLGSRTHGTAESAQAAEASAPAASAVKARKLLYYRNPMGLPDTSPTPKKDPMGMDYIAVYEGEDDAPAEPGAGTQVRISTEKVQKLGVRTEAAGMRPLGQTLHAAGRVEPDERRMYAISPKFEGYVEKLHVNVTGQAVAKGQPLFEVYSPELVSAQREYAIAVQGAKVMKDAAGDAQDSMRQLADASLTRLGNWDLSSEQIAALVKSGEVRRTVTFRSPVAGVVTEKKALQGMRFMPGDALYQVTDLSSVWVIADVFEKDLAQVRLGSKAGVTLAAYPSQRFEGTVSYIYPTLKPETRTVPIRVELPNPRQLLKPAMFAEVEIKVGSPQPVLAIPDSAVIDSGQRQIVLVQRQEGRFEAREVKLGARSDNYVEVLAGVKAGEPVVVAANFLIDAESNLKAAVGGLGGHAGHGASVPAQATPDEPKRAAKAGGVGHHAEGSVESIDAKAGTLSLNHGAVASLKWPAMTMEFAVANASLLKGLKPGTQVAFDFVERQPGEWVITAIAPLAGQAPANPHAGH